MGIWNLLDDATRVAEDFPVGSIIKAGQQFIKGEGEEGAFTLAKGVTKKSLFGAILGDDNETPIDADD